MSSGNTLSADVACYYDCFDIAYLIGPPAEIDLGWNNSGAYRGDNLTGWGAVRIGDVTEGSLGTSAGTLGISGQTVTNFTVKYVGGADRKSVV